MNRSCAVRIVSVRFSIVIRLNFILPDVHERPVNQLDKVLRLHIAHLLPTIVVKIIITYRAENCNTRTKSVGCFYRQKHKTFRNRKSTFFADNGKRGVQNGAVDKPTFSRDKRNAKRGFEVYFLYSSNKKGLLT